MFEKLIVALEARAPIRTTDTNALRIVDGTGDGFDDFAIDDFAGRWLVESRGPFPVWLSGEEGDNLEIRKAGKEESSLPDFLISRFNSDGVPLPHSIYWKRLGDKESPRWIAGEKLAEPFVVRENGAQYWIDFNSGYSQGIFLDQRDNRLALRNMARGKSVLNCFAYTCAFGVAGALGGAQTTNIDLSKRYLEWGKRNYTLNGVPASAPHDFIFGDASDWLKRFRKKERKFDIILLDPPTFSRNEKGAVFTIESGFTDLVRQAAALLASRGMLFCSTNQRSISSAEFRGLIADGLGDLRDWKLRAGAMPADFSGGDYLKTWWANNM